MEVKRNEEINQVMEAKDTNDSGMNLPVMQSFNDSNNGRKTTKELRHQRKLQRIKWDWLYRLYDKGSFHWI